MELVQRPEKKGIKVVIWIFTIVVFALVASLDRIPKPEVPPGFTKALPSVNAILNSLVFLSLVTSLIMIKKKKVMLHARLNTFAMLLSVFFLLSYVTYHITNPGIKYSEVNPDAQYAGVYYFVLFSHILTSGISLPFILFAYYRAWIGDIEKHRKVVKFAYPIWLYVSITGPMVYLFLAPYY